MIVHVAEMKTELQGGSSTHQKPQCLVAEVGFEPRLQRCRARTQHPSLSASTVGALCWSFLFCFCFNHIGDNVALSHGHWSIFSLGEETLTWWPFDHDLITHSPTREFFKQPSMSFEPRCLFLKQTFNEGETWRFSEHSWRGRASFVGCRGAEGRGGGCPTFSWGLTQPKPNKAHGCQSSLSLVAKAVFDFPPLAGLDLAQQMDGRGLTRCQRWWCLGFLDHKSSSLWSGITLPRWKMACSPGDPPNLVSRVGRGKRWAPDLTKLEKWWLLLEGIWLRKSLLMNAGFKRDLVCVTWCCVSTKKGLVNFFLPATMVEADKAQPKEGRRMPRGEGRLSPGVRGQWL